MLVLLIGLCNIIREQLQAVLPPIVNCQIHSSASNFARDMVLNSDAAASGISTRDSQNNFMSFIIVPSTTTQQQPHFRCRNSVKIHSAHEERTKCAFSGKG
jgi:hypothetical protein